MKIAWRGTVNGVQLRIRLTRSFDERSHTYLGFVPRIHGEIGTEARQYPVTVGDGAYAKHQFEVGDHVLGEGHPVADPHTVTAELYRVYEVHRVKPTLLRRVCCVLAAAVVLASVARAGQPAVDAERTPSVQTVLVLPFANTSGVEQDEWIGVGIADTLNSELPRLSVVSVANDGVGLRATPVSGMAWIVAGSYQRVADDLRIIGTLLEAETGVVIHTFKIDGAFSELFSLQDRVAAEISAAIPTRLAPPTAVASSEASDGSAADLHQPPAQPAPPQETRAAFVPVTAAGFAVSGVTIDGPPPPVPPAVVTRDAVGRATIRANRLTTPLRVDGVLDEDVYQRVAPVSDFVQTEPDPGAAATERTDIWVLFDRDNVYVVARCWESHPERMIVNEMRRDSNNILQNENFAFILDTFYDRRNALIVNLNPIGGRSDGQITDERGYSGDWNPVYTIRTGEFDGGWTVEVGIPFKSLRYKPGREQTWGFNARRLNRWKNESSFVVRMPRARGLATIFQISQAATLVGLEVPAGGRGAFELKPYAISEASGRRSGTPGISNDVTGDMGVDAKYGVTRNLVADLTVNTDFAQVDADEQQVNLSRFSLFFPEKREFFLENQGTFAFGGASSVGSFGGGTDVPLLFYSREIGLYREQEVPMVVGGRLTGRVGKFSIGFMNVRTGDVARIGARATNFSVVRVRRDLLRRSNVGFLFTGRSISRDGAGTGETYGADGVFSFYDNLNINTYWAKTETPGRTGDDVSHRAQLDYAGDRYGLQVERLVVGGDFNPEVGFLRRDDFDRRFGMFRFSPRPERSGAVRKLTFQGQVAYV